MDHYSGHTESSEVTSTKGTNPTTLWVGMAQQDDHQSKVQLQRIKDIGLLGVMLLLETQARLQKLSTEHH